MSVSWSPRIILHVLLTEQWVVTKTRVLPKWVGRPHPTPESVVFGRISMNCVDWRHFQLSTTRKKPQHTWWCVCQISDRSLLTDCSVTVAMSVFWKPRIILHVLRLLSHYRYVRHYRAVGRLFNIFTDTYWRLWYFSMPRSKWVWALKHPRNDVFERIALGYVDLCPKINQKGAYKNIFLCLRRWEGRKSCVWGVTM